MALLPKYSIGNDSEFERLLPVLPILNEGLLLYRPERVLAVFLSATEDNLIS